MRLSGVFDKDLVPTVEVLAGSGPQTLTKLPLIFDTGFNLSVSITEETLRMLEIEDVSVETRTVLTASGHRDFKFCVLFARAGEIQGYFDAIVAHVDALGMRFVEGRSAKLVFACGENFLVE
jgi:hypothetical protein